MEKILEQMFNGWILHENSWDGEKYTRLIEDCMIEVCDGNRNYGLLVNLFSHWSNDIQGLAPHFGLALERDENNKLYILKEIPAAPSEDHYWTGGRWVEPSDKYGEI